ncbi:hypothetical protein [Labrys wisconsinensis]|uniref:Uncharacterized protein n=1 Tax=Labrys wisconsinensis TaxID=425677 RepID=A0ABU0JCJ9_9HYPH|nr:hypothetical protein [Labrys wisconsinensis]MDQ0472016.1 hypothetical protein [Labrys wisconsinensis]
MWTGRLLGAGLLLTVAAFALYAFWKSRGVKPDGDGNDGPSLPGAG